MLTTQTAKPDWPPHQKCERFWTLPRRDRGGGLVRRGGDRDGGAHSLRIRRREVALLVAIEGAPEIAGVGLRLWNLRYWISVAVNFPTWVVGGRCIEKQPPRRNRATKRSMSGGEQTMRCAPARGRGIHQRRANQTIAPGCSTRPPSELGRELENLRPDCRHLAEGNKRWHLVLAANKEAIQLIEIFPSGRVLLNRRICRARPQLLLTQHREQAPPS